MCLPLETEYVRVYADYFQFTDSSSEAVWKKRFTIQKAGKKFQVSVFNEQVWSLTNTKFRRTSFINNNFWLPYSGGNLVLVILNQTVWPTN